MTNFTFTSEDLEKINADKKPNDKVFAQLENVRVAPGLMEKDKVTINWKQVEEDFLSDAIRGTPTILKKGEDLKVILGTNNLDTQEQKESEVQKNMQYLIGQGLSEEQIKDFKFMTNQANIGSVAADVLMYTVTKAPAIFPNIQNVGGAVVQLDITKTMPDNQERLTYRTATRVTFDKGRTECNYSPYGMSSSYEIPSKDSMIIVLQVDLGPLGDKDYKPLLTCSIHAEGRDAEKVLANIKQDIPTNVTQKTKNSESIKAEYEEIAVKTLKLTGQEEVFYRNVKDHIGEILSGQEIGGGKLEAIKEFKSTPKLFAEVLVDKISEINKIEDHKQRDQKIKQLSDNAANFADQPKGYMKILIKNTAQEMAKEANIDLPKEGIISKISSNIKLMLAKINVKVRGKSEEVEKTKDFITKARTARQSQALGH